LAPAALQAAGCRAEAQGPPPRVFELYTSEGCDSCPKVDAWLSTLKGQPGALPLAFHIDYFDKLGWKDRFSSAAHTRRQKEMQAYSGVPTIYTPQVLIDGHDTRAGEPPPAAAEAAVQVSLQREGTRYKAQLRSMAARPLALIGFWALTENGLSTQVTGGENMGRKLEHDFVVRDYRKLRPWTLAPGETLSLDYEPAVQGGMLELALVLQDSASGRTVQALRLSGC
jgi:hypothetical protein